MKSKEIPDTVAEHVSLDILLEHKYYLRRTMGKGEGSVCTYVGTP